MSSSDIRADLRNVADMVKDGSRVLDVGCGDGDLLKYLVREKKVDGRGVEMRKSRVNTCVSEGLSVIQGDADTDLVQYPDKSFDYAILSLTLQATRNPRAVLEELVRIADHAIVSLPNFGHWRVRLMLLFGGRMPVTSTLPDSWWSTQNIHFCTIQDFVDLSKDMDLQIEQALALDRNGKPISDGLGQMANLFGETGVFRLSRKG